MAINGRTKERSEESRTFTGARGLGRAPTLYIMLFVFSCFEGLNKLVNTVRVFAFNLASNRKIRGPIGCELNLKWAKSFVIG
jgi:hypothetical protein